MVEIIILVIACVLSFTLGVLYEIWDKKKRMRTREWGK
jgi:hypothetical protein